MVVQLSDPDPVCPRRRRPARYLAEIWVLMLPSGRPILYTGIDGTPPVSPRVAYAVVGFVEAALEDALRRDNSRFPLEVWDWVAGMKALAATFPVEVDDEAKKNGSAEVPQRRHDEFRTATMNISKKTLTVQEVADQIGASTGYVRRLCRKNQLTAEKAGKDWRVVPNERLTRRTG